MASRRSSKKIRYGIIGLGYISQSAVLPAFEHTKRKSVVGALISDDPQKLKELGAQYNVERTYSYNELEECLHSGEIDAVYIALPNHMHREYAIRAARAGIHVLCEKPMAVTSQECQEMIDAARENRVKLMISYRLHFEEANLKAVETLKSGRLGEPRFFSSMFSMQVKGENIRLNDLEKGGGPLYDLGIYCINASRYLFQAEPVEVEAFSTRGNDPRFQNSEEMVSATLRFPGERFAQFTCSFNAADVSTYTVAGTNGELKMESAYEHTSPIIQEITSNGEKDKKKFKKRDQFAAVLDYFSNCILNDQEPEPSGREGLADVRIIEALHRSAQEQKAIALEPFEREHRPSMDQEIEKPPISEQELVHAEPPSRS